MNVLLDTNAYKRFLLGHEDVNEIIVKATVTYLSVIVIGELYAGFKGGNKMEKNIEMLEDLLLKPFIKVVDVTQNTSQVYGELKYLLRKKGKPIPVNDIWIAAHAIETGSVLITYDKHFLNIYGLRVWDNL